MAVAYEVDRSPHRTAYASRAFMMLFILYTTTVDVHTLGEENGHNSPTVLTYVPLQQLYY